MKFDFLGKKSELIFSEKNRKFPEKEEYAQCRTKGSDCFIPYLSTGAIRLTELRIRLFTSLLETNYHSKYFLKFVQPIIDQTKRGDC